MASGCPGDGAGWVMGRVAGSTWKYDELLHLLWTTKEAGNHFKDSEVKVLDDFRSLWQAIALDCLGLLGFGLDWIGLEPRGMFLSRRYPKILMWILGNAGRAKMKEWTHLTERGVPTRGETGHYAPLQPATLQHETFSRVPLHTHTLTHTDTHWHTHTRAGPKDSHDPPLGRQQK